MPARTVFLDTSFIVALENRDDAAHEQAKALDRELLAARATLVLHWGILLEIGDGYARLGRRTKGIELLSCLREDPGYELAPLTDDILAEAAQLYGERVDKEWGLTDCVSFVVMRRLGISEALTADEHFSQAGFHPLLRS